MSDRSKALGHVWWMENYKLALAKGSESDSTTDYVSPTEVKTVTVYYSASDQNFVPSGTGIDMTEAPAIPEEFHDALAQYAIAKGYELKPETLQAAQYFKREFEMCVREGKKYANKGKDGSSYNIRQHDF